MREKVLSLLGGKERGASSFIFLWALLTMKGNDKQSETFQDPNPLGSIQPDAPELR